MNEAASQTWIDAIKAVQLPWLDCDIGATGARVSIDGAEAAVSAEIEFGFPVDGVRDDIAAAVRQRLEADGLVPRSVAISWQVKPRAVPTGVKPLEGVSNIVAVASGKGGVGKSTTAVNLALALAADGAAVGILDADIYGPSIPRMLGAGSERPTSEDGSSFEPIRRHGIAASSIGFLIDEEQPMVWRGPMVTQALTQLLTQTNWGELDYLLVDMPPGTGDIQLTLTQRVPVNAAIIVTTPQDIALLDARKGLRMFEKVNVPVLGIIENMSTYVCPECGNVADLFGSGGGERMAADYDTPLLGQLPLDIRIRRETDGGTPTVAAEPGSPVASAYGDIARRAAAALAMQRRGYASSFPNIVVEDS